LVKLQAHKHCSAAQRQTWPSYEHTNTALQHKLGQVTSTQTLLLLVTIHPCGVIKFLSKLYVGSISDLEIVKKSQFVDLIEPGDDVMADRGFNIRHLLLPKRATLNIPAFSKGKALSLTAVVLAPSLLYAFTWKEQ
jgi:hypothetical protein